MLILRNTLEICMNEFVKSTYAKLKQIIAPLISKQMVSFRYRLDCGYLFAVAARDRVRKPLTIEHKVIWYAVRSIGEQRGLPVRRESRISFVENTDESENTIHVLSSQCKCTKNSRNTRYFPKLVTMPSARDALVSRPNGLFQHPLESFSQPSLGKSVVPELRLRGECEEGARPTSILSFEWGTLIDQYFLIGVRIIKIPKIQTPRHTPDLNI